MEETRESLVEPGAAKGQPLTRRVPVLWGLVALAIAALTGASVLVLLRAARGPRPPFLEARGRAAAPAQAPPTKSTTALVLAGSGSNLPLTRALVEAFRQRTANAKVIVHESIGSSGGIRAVRDRAIDIGLISRALSDDEGHLGIVVTPYARVAVVVAANPTVPDTCVSSGDLVAMFAGAHPRWSDGSHLVMLQRERGDSSFLAVSRFLPELGAQNEAAYREGRWRVLYDDRSMQEALMATEGAVGVFDLGAIVSQRLPIKVLCVDGRTPPAGGEAQGTYPFWKDLAFVTAAAPSGVAADLLRFVLSAEGRELTSKLGYLPLPLPASEPAKAGGAP